MSTPAPANKSAALVSRRWLAPSLMTALLLLSIWVMTRAWNASLLDRFQFRQSQTALTAYWFQREDFKAAYPLPIFGPPWSAPLEFPLYQWIVARLSNTTGMSLVSAARTCGIFFFLISLPAVYGLAGTVEPNPRRRLLVPAAVLTAPVCLFYSRAFMIESCAAAFSVWFLYSYQRSLRMVNWRWTLVALVTGVAAALVKVTTLALFGPPAVVLTLYEGLKLYRIAKASHVRASLGRLAVTALIPAIPILAATVWWVHFSDAVKDANPIAEMLSSRNLTGWQFGTLVQRFSPEFWKFVGHQWSVGAVSIFATVPLIASSFIVAPRYRLAALWSVAAFLTGPLVFTNLFSIHEYYYFPSAFFATMAAGFVLAGLCESPRLPVVAKTIALAGFLVLQGVDFDHDYAKTLKQLPAPPPPMIGVVGRVTPKDGVVLIYGWDWNTLIPYYAERRAILMPQSQEDNPAALLEILRRLPPGQVTTLVMQGNKRESPAFIKWCATLLNLSLTPLFKSPDGDVYVTDARKKALKAEFARNPFPVTGFDFSETPIPSDSKLHYQKPNPADYREVASPPPFAVFSPWEIVVAGIAGAPGISANTPSELHFDVPSGATHVEAIVGIIEGAYIGNQKTDGLEVVIFELKPGGEHRVFYRRYLDPAAHPADRGLQKISFDLPGRITGPLVFAMYPGPSDNISFDWGFWRKIEIK